MLAASVLEVQKDHSGGLYGGGFCISESSVLELWTRGYVGTPACLGMAFTASWRNFVYVHVAAAV